MILRSTFLWLCFFITFSFAKPNVLFIAVDDLRPELACYGKQHIHSPNIDALAKSGVLFERAYCMVPTCGASRASLLTGLRPSPSRFKNYLTWAEKDAEGITTLNTHFKQSGYTTVGLGKIFHHKTDSRIGWSKDVWQSKINDWHDLPAKRAAVRKLKRANPEWTKNRGAPFESFDAPDDEYRDGATAAQAIKELEALAKTPDQPFFLAVGFYKPHLPFCAPKKYWDMYDAAEIELPNNRYAPKDAPEGAVHTSGELRSYATVPPAGPMSEEMARNLIHGYFACVSFTDAQVGRLLDALDRLNLAEDTIVVLWGDHGWQLGEHGMWIKHSCFETSMHAPLLVRVPGRSIKAGTRVTSLVEFIDIYPTLCDLTNTEPPSHLQGDSMVPLMLDPTATWKKYAIGRYKNGDTIKSDTHRFSEYRTRSGEVSGAMLYDHRDDPDENTNVASSSDAVVGAMTTELNKRKGKN